METVKRITSFSVDHDYITPGIYISRIDGDITTYDMRTRKPNCDEYMDNITMHSVEHMMATFLRNSDIGDSIIYFGPMGCRTGFYLLVRNVPDEIVLKEVKTALKKIVMHNGDVFGASRKECGNYKELDMESARKECQRYLDALENYGVIDFKYKTGEDSV